MAVKYGHGENATTYLTVPERNLAAHAKYGDGLSVDTEYLGLVEEAGKKEYGFKCTLTVVDNDNSGITLRTVTGWGRKVTTENNAFAKAETQAFGRALQHLGFVGDADIANAFDEEDLEGGEPVTETQDEASQEEALVTPEAKAIQETYERLGLTDVYIDSIDEFYVNSLQRIREETKDADKPGLFNLIKGRRQALGHDAEIVVEMAQKLFKRTPQQLSEEELRQMICKMDEMVKAQLESPAMSV